MNYIFFYVKNTVFESKINNKVTIYNNRDKHKQMYLLKAEHLKKEIS